MEKSFAVSKLPDASSGHAQSPQRQDRVEEQCSQRRGTGLSPGRSFQGIVSYQQSTNYHTKHYAKVPTASYVSCNFLPNTWLSVTEEAVFDAIVDVIAVLVSDPFQHLYQVPGYFLFPGLYRCSVEKSQKTPVTTISQCFILNKGYDLSLDSDVHFPNHIHSNN